MCWGSALGAAFRLLCVLPGAAAVAASWREARRAEAPGLLRVPGPAGAVRGRAGREVPWGLCGHFYSAWLGAGRPGFQDRFSLLTDNRTGTEARGLAFLLHEVFLEASANVREK